MRILIVDDNQQFLDAARSLLLREGVADVDVVSSASEALRHADAARPDVILVDINLGEENGFDVVEQLARLDDGPRPQLVLISTYAEQDVRDLVEASPAIGFLPKSQLSRAAIAELSRRPDPSA